MLQDSIMLGVRAPACELDPHSQRFDTREAKVAANGTKMRPYRDITSRKLRSGRADTHYHPVGWQCAI